MDELGLAQYHLTHWAHGVFTQPTKRFPFILCVSASRKILFPNEIILPDGLWALAGLSASWALPYPHYLT